MVQISGVAVGQPVTSTVTSTVSNSGVTVSQVSQGAVVLRPGSSGVTSVTRPGQTTIRLSPVASPR